MRKLQKSKKLFEESRRYFAGGVGSNPRLIRELGFPIYFERGMGSKIYDADGNEYIDYVLGMGPLILGHCPSAVVEAVKKQLDMGTIFASSIPQELDLSRKVCECFPSVELVRFTNSGSEAVHMALRLARAYTGKSKILKFEGAYHGWFDDILVSVHPDSLNMAGLEDSPYRTLETPGQSESVLQDILIAPWNQPDVIDRVVRRHGNEIAAIIAEPILANNAVIPPNNGFLEALREITEKNEIILIFDEIITGFRIALGGAQEYYNVKPDLTVFGKGMGGGYPIAGFGGKKGIMNLVAEARVGHSGTYNSNPLCVAAAVATLNELTKDHGTVISRITEIGKKLMRGIKEILLQNDLPVVLQGPGSFFSVLFTNKPVVSYRDTFGLNGTLYSKFSLALLDKGIRIWPSARALWYLSAAHTEEDIEFTLGAIKSVIKDLKK